MAAPKAQFRPGRPLAVFGFIVVALYSLVFFTSGSHAPKLGIDLQGGTRITLQAQTLDGQDPSAESMKLARSVMENRVNGTGVVGAQVQLDGARQLVVTVPGEKTDLGNLTRTAALNIRAVLRDTAQSPGIFAAGPKRLAELEAEHHSTGAEPTATSPTSSASGSASTSTEAAAGVGSSAEAVASAGSTEPAASAETSPAVSESAPAPGAESTPSAGPTATASILSQTPQTAPVSRPGKTGAIERFPASSNRENPTQPASSEPTAWDAWYTDIQNALAQHQFSCEDLAPYQGLDDPNRPLVACDQRGEIAYLLDKTLIPGTEIASATSGMCNGGAGFCVSVRFTDNGFGTWYNYTAQHNETLTGGSSVGNLTAFTLDGEVLSAPSIRVHIQTQPTEVQGTFTQDEASSLAGALKFGALPLAFTQDKTETVSAQLGVESLRAGLIAGGIGLLLVVVYCLIYYRALGLITILSLALSGALVYAVMVLLGRWMNLSLDMAGIAGLIIAIGITADSFVVYFERIKDEVREGRTFRSSVSRGWERARRTILSADAVTFLSAIILYMLAVGDVKGFAFTLGLSTALDLVIVFLVTHPLVTLAARSKMLSSPRWSGLGAVAAAGARHRAETVTISAAAKEA